MIAIATFIDQAMHSLRWELEKQDIRDQRLYGGNT